MSHVLNGLAPETQAIVTALSFQTTLAGFKLMLSSYDVLVESYRIEEYSNRNRDNQIRMVLKGNLHRDSPFVSTCLLRIDEQGRIAPIHIILLVMRGSRSLHASCRVIRDDCGTRLVLTRDPVGSN